MIKFEFQVRVEIYATSQFRLVNIDSFIRSAKPNKEEIPGNRSEVYFWSLLARQKIFMSLLALPVIIYSNEVFFVFYFIFLLI